MTFRFIVILSTNCLTANAQSQSSCLVQQRFDSAKSGEPLTEPRDGRDGPFSIEQQQCIQRYISDVRTLWPGYDLSTRRFGGSGDVVPDKHNAVAGSATAPVLGVGFGTTATRSLAVFGRQLGLKVHHFDPYDTPLPHWLDLDELLLHSCALRPRLDAVNFSELVFSSGSDLLLDTPMAELFLDFYAVSPRSKVILTLRDPAKWAKSRSQGFSTSPMPVQSPCDANTGSLSVEDSAKLFGFHSDLVRCMVPATQLLELNVEQALDSAEIAQFLGVVPAFYVPFPKVNLPVHDFFDASPGSPPTSSLFVSPQISPSDSGYRLGDRLPVCITGQIQRLELQTKVEHFLDPMTSAGHLVEVYLVLDPRPRGPEAVRGRFESLNETVPELPPKMTAVFDPWAPPHLADDSAETKMRLKFGALQRCWQLIRHNSREAPKMAVHLRDDMAFLERLRLESPRLEDMPRGVHAARCAALKDAAIVSGEGEVQTYFTAPLTLMRQNFAEKSMFQPSDAEKPLESVLHAMQLSKVSIHPLQVPMLPVAWIEETRKVTEDLCFLKNDWEDCDRPGLGPGATGARLISTVGEVQYICENPGTSSQGGPF